MYKCVRIKVSYPHTEVQMVRQALEQQARDLGIEGVMRRREDSSYDIIISGAKERVDTFIEAIAHYKDENKVSAFEVEAAVKERDYRGVFRVIE